MHVVACFGEWDGLNQFGNFIVGAFGLPEEGLETLLSCSPVGIGFVDRECRLVRLNEMLAQFSGSSVEEQLGRRIADVVPAIWSQIEPAFRRALDTG